MRWAALAFKGVGVGASVPVGGRLLVRNLLCSAARGMPSLLAGAENEVQRAEGVAFPSLRFTAGARRGINNRRQDNAVVIDCP